MTYSDFLHYLDVATDLAIIVVCLWAVLSPNVPTRLFGTVSLAATALAAAVSLAPPEVITPIFREVQIWRQLATAWFGGWMYSQFVCVPFGRKLHHD